MRVECSCMGISALIKEAPESCLIPLSDVKTQEKTVVPEPEREPSSDTRSVCPFVLNAFLSSVSHRLWHFVTAAEKDWETSSGSWSK